MKKHLFNILIGLIMVATSGFTFQGITPYLLEIKGIPTADEKKIATIQDSLKLIQSQLEYQELECRVEVTRLQVENTVLDTINQSIITEFNELVKVAEKAIELEKKIIKHPPVQYIQIKSNRDSIYQEVLREKALKMHKDRGDVKHWIKDSNGKLIK